jgi:hypothetical protein
MRISVDTNDDQLPLNLLKAFDDANQGQTIQTDGEDYTM